MFCLKCSWWEFDSINVVLLVKEEFLLGALREELVVAEESINVDSLVKAEFLKRVLLEELVVAEESFNGRKFNRCFACRVGGG